MGDAEEIQNLKSQIQNLQVLVANMQVLGIPEQGLNQAANIAQHVPTPEKFSHKSNDWESWSQHYERYRVSTKLQNTSEEIQMNNLLLHMGSKVNKIFERLQKNQENFTTYADLKNALDNHFKKKTNVIYERAKFNQRNQSENESAEEYINTVITMAKQCKYGTLEDELIRDKLIVGIKDRKLSEILQLDESLTLAKTIDKIKQSETIKSQNEEIRKRNNAQQIDRIQHKKSYKEKRKQKEASDRDHKIYPECKRCGARPSHRLRDCPALKEKCTKCGIKGHYKRCCKTKTYREVRKQSTTESEATDESSEKCDEIKMINKINKTKEPWTTQLKIHDKIIQFKIDTGADATVMTKESYEKIKSKVSLKPTSTILVGPGKDKQRKIETLGKIKVLVKHKNKQEMIKIYVAKTSDNLLGRPALQKLRLVEWKNQRLEIEEIKTIVDNEQPTEYVEQITQKFAKVFQGVGCIKNYEYNIEVEENTMPYVVSTPRRVPFPLLEEVRKTLTKMQKDGIIEKINEPTKWCSPMVVVRKKNGDIRICTDFTKLNPYIKRERYQLPAVEETLAKIQDGKIYSKLDCSSGFWQMKLTEKSRVITTFITPYGRFVYKRCPFGITSAPEVFQKVMNQIIDSCASESVAVHADDIIVCGKNKAEHDKNLETVLKTLEKNGVTLNKNKCEFRVNQIKYLGYLVTSEGLKPDLKYVEAIKNYPEPKTVSEVRKFLGVVTYLTKFIENYSSKIHPLRELLRKNNQFRWGVDQQRCFNKLKEDITQVPILAAYNLNYPTRISADASAYGIGGVLEQQQPNQIWKPVCFCSRSLSEAEQRYAQIEKECLAITFACNRLKQFVIGKRFEIQTDHKPLLAILTSKPINDLTSRLQNFRMKMSIFDYNIIHVPGKEFFVPDALSRAPLPADQEREDVILSTKMKTIAYMNSMNERNCLKYQQEDEALKIISEYIKTGWPNEKRKCSPLVIPYYKFRNEIAMEENLLTYQERIIIPRMLRKKCLEDIHEGHLGINKCRARAKQTIWWPGISKQINELISNCEICLKDRKPRVEPMLYLEIPTIPWDTIGTDLFEWKGKTYIVVQDYYSLFLEIEQLKRTESKDIIEFMKKIFSRFGIPRVVRSDNGRQFDCMEFKTFADAYGFKWKPSSPKHAQSNGLAESAVKTAKRILKKSQDFYLGLLAYRNTPLECGASPSQLLMSRQLRERLPIQKRKLEPTIQNHEKILQKKKRQKETQKFYFDRRHRARKERELEGKERVWITDKEKEGVVKSKISDRSYLVTTGNRQIRRNRQHLQPLPSQTENKKIKQGNTTKEVRNNTERRSRRNRKVPKHFKDYIQK